MSFAQFGTSLCPNSDACVCFLHGNGESLLFLAVLFGNRFYKKYYDNTVVQ